MNVGYAYRKGVPVSDVLTDGTNFWKRLEETSDLEHCEYGGFQANGKPHNGNSKYLKFKTQEEAAEWTKRWESAPVRWFVRVYDVDGPQVFSADERILDGVLYSWEGRELTSEEAVSFTTPDEAIEEFLAVTKKQLQESVKKQLKRG